ncbi:MAG: hypothetical protein ACK5ML_01840 [Lachnospiraceae bacterium]
MAAAQKSYTQCPEIIWNLVNDYVEMRKGSIRSITEESMIVETDMYKIKTLYLIRITKSYLGGTILSVETLGDSEDDRVGIEIFFLTIENLLKAFQ